MPIDDPVQITIQQTKEELASSDYLPMKLAKLGISGLLAAALEKHPFLSELFTSLLTSNSSRVEKRLVCVLEELDAQQKRIEKNIPDKKYYESEEFHSLLGLVIESIQTTHDEEKLRSLGDALANSGSREFQDYDKEDYVRILRDLSAKDLKVLNHEQLKGWLPHVHVVNYGPEILSSLSRLEGMGLVTQILKPPSLANTGSDRTDAQLIIKELLTSSPKRTYSLSPFGAGFLQFIASGAMDSNATT